MSPCASTTCHTVAVGASMQVPNLRRIFQRSQAEVPLLHRAENVLPVVRGHVTERKPTIRAEYGLG